MRNISKCYKAHSSKRSSLSIGLYGVRLFLSVDDNLCFDNTDERVFKTTLSLCYCFERIKHEKD